MQCSGATFSVGIFACNSGVSLLKAHQIFFFKCFKINLKKKIQPERKFQIVEVPRTAWRVITLTCLKFLLQAIVSLGQVRDRQNTTQKNKQKKKLQCFMWEKRHGFFSNYAVLRLNESL
jgi:hypothetical protein